MDDEVEVFLGKYLRRVWTDGWGGKSQYIGGRRKAETSCDGTKMWHIWNHEKSLYFWAWVFL